jgi:hypothetical protein
MNAIGGFINTVFKLMLIIMALATWGSIDLIDEATDLFDV